MMNISPLLEHNIILVRNDAEYLAVEKMSIADALYGLSVAKGNTDDERLKRLLDVANEVIMSYMYCLRLFAED